MIRSQFSNGDSPIQMKSDYHNDFKYGLHMGKVTDEQSEHILETGFKKLKTQKFYNKFC